MNRTRKVIGGTLSSVMQIVVAMALQIVLMPLILRTVGQEVLGVYAIILQIVGYLALMDLGISTALNRALSQATHEDARFWALLNTGILLLVALGVGNAALGVVLALAIGDLFHLSPALAEQARVAMLLLAAWGLLRFPLSVGYTGLYAIQDLTIPPLLGALSNIARMILSVAAVTQGAGLVGLVAASALTEALLFVMLLIRFVRLKPGWLAHRPRVHQPVMRELFDFGLKALLGNLSGRIILFSDNIMVGYLHGAAAASIYYNTQTPITIAYALVLRLSDNATPAANELWAQREYDKLRDIFMRLQRVTLLLAAPIVVAGWFYLSATISVWVGAAQFGGEWMTLWFIAFALSMALSHVPRLFVYASGNIQRFTQLTLVEAAFNLLLSLLLGRWLGPHGVALATVAAHVPTTLYAQWRVQRDLRVTANEWLTQILQPAFVASIPLAIAAALLINWSPPASWLALGAHALVLSAVHALSTYFLGLSPADHTLLARLADRRLRLGRSERNDS